MKGVKNVEENREEKLSRDDPDYYRKIRSKRKTYPKHDGQFDKDSAKKNGSKGGSKSKRPKARKLPR